MIILGVLSYLFFIGYYVSFCCIDNPLIHFYCKIYWNTKLIRWNIKEKREEDIELQGNILEDSDPSSEEYDYSTDSTVYFDDDDKFMSLITLKLVITFCMLHYFNEICI